MSDTIEIKTKEDIRKYSPGVGDVIWNGGGYYMIREVNGEGLFRINTHSSTVEGARKSTDPNGLTWYRKDEGSVPSWIKRIHPMQGLYKDIPIKFTF